MRSINRRNGNKGFTLIELLIVIAIIGILAAVLIPQLMGARIAAQDRAAQAYGAQVLTAVTAVMSEDINLEAADAAALASPCGGGTTLALSSENSQVYGVADPGAAVTCSAAANDNQVEITTTGPTNTYINGRLQP